MGKSQTFDIDTGWERAAAFLDAAFPLSRGSHRDAADYLVQLDHLLVIAADGSCSGLARPGQLVEADGDDHAPSAITLAEDGDGEEACRVEIEPCNRRARAEGRCREHRLHLLVETSAA